MKLEEAIKDFRNGEKIRRTSWKKDYYICKGEAFNCVYSVTPGDLCATDWEVLRPEVPFWMAIRALMDGKVVKDSHGMSYEYRPQEGAGKHLFRKTGDGFCWNRDLRSVDDMLTRRWYICE
jgi:hypothetical protein